MHHTLAQFITILYYRESLFYLTNVMSLPVSLVIILTKATQPPAHTHSGIAVGSDKQYLSHKIMTL
jgi:hypothetical protein